MKTLTLFLTVLLVQHAQAADIVWTNLNGGNWGAPSNWSPNMVPGVSDQAFITNSGTYRVTNNVAASLTNLVVGGMTGTQTLVNMATLAISRSAVFEPNTVLDLAGTIGGAGSLRIDGLMNWSRGTLGIDSVTINGSLIISPPRFEAVTFSGRVMTNTGRTTLINGFFNLADTSSFQNLRGAIFESSVIGSDGVYEGTIGMSSTTTTAVFNNAGIFRKTRGTNTLRITTIFHNTGTLEVQTGTIWLQNLFRSQIMAGQLVRAAGATLELAGTTSLASGLSSFRLDPGIGFAGDGTLNVTAVDVHTDLNIGGRVILTNSSFGRINLRNGVTLATTNLVVTGDLWADGCTLLANGPLMWSGTLRGSNNLTVNGPMTWAGGHFMGSGPIILNGGLLVGAAADKIATGRSVSHAGYGLWTNGTIFLDPGSVFHNRAGATFETRFDGRLTSHNGTYTSASFINSGTFRKTGGTNTTFIDVNFNHTGLLEVEVGTVRFRRDFTQSSGRTVLAGGTVAAASFVHIQSGSVEGTGTVMANVLTNNGQIYPVGALTNVGNYVQPPMGY